MPEPSAPSHVHQAVHRLSWATARALSPLYLRSVTSLGRRPRLRGAPLVRNRGRITIGDDFRLDSRPVRSHLVTGRAGTIEIGHGVSIASGAAISAEVHVRIGDRVRMGGSVMIMDTDYHDRRDFSAPAPRAPVVVEDEARLGRNVTVLKGARIGRGAWIAPGSVVSGVVPAGACAGGVPARVLASLPAVACSRTGREATDPLGRVRAVVAETFGIAPPDPADGPSRIPAWDSLGALRLLMALEEEFQVVLPDTVAEAKSVLDLCDAVARRRPGE